MSVPAAAADWIRRLALEPHPEGGFYRETYRAAASIGTCCLAPGFDGPRSVATAIYYLLVAGARSALHRIRSDEGWHHYDGDPLVVHVLEPGGAYRRVVLGKGSDARPQAVVPAGAWFGAEVEPPGEWALVGCTVAPGFDFRDFELARAEELAARFPDRRALIGRLAAP